AVTHHLRAAGLARSRYGFEQAAAHYRQAIELLRRLPASAGRDEREIHLQSDLATTVFAMHGPGAEQLEAIGSRIETLSGMAETTPALLRVLLGLISAGLSRGNLGRAEALCARVLERATPVAACALEADVARSLLGFTQQRRGNLAA